MALLVGVSAAGAAQQPQPGAQHRRDEIVAGSDREHLLIDRYGRRANMPVGVRPFGPLMLDSLFSLEGVAATEEHHARFRWASSWSALWFNTQRANNEGGGPVWRGRGATLAASTGFTGRWAMVSYAVRPIGFWSANRPYAPSRTVMRQDFQDPWMADRIDLPYRFGPRGYGRVDVGESYLRVDTRFLAVGLSNESQVWGPARRYPLVLGNSAGGFPHVFIETGTPRPVGIGRVHARWLAGRLASSAFGPAHLGTSTRMGIGAVGTFVPRGMDGLEVGASRFFHLYDSAVARDLESLSLPFSGLLKKGLRDPDASGARNYNQVASVFMRVAPRNSPAELYGEFYREDHSWDARDLIGEPDHASAYLVGVVRTFQGPDLKSATLTVEMANSRISHFSRVRGQSPAYVHSPVVEGHTMRGQTLGSPVIPGGGALSAYYERRSLQASWSVLGEVARRAQNAEGGTLNGLATGQYTIGVGREVQVGQRRWNAQALWQPGFGDLPGTNVSLVIRRAN